MSLRIPSWGELKRRKLVQWGLAYLAGAFAALQLLDILASHFGWPGVLTRGAIVLLGFGFFVALVLAWYHGEKGRQRVSGPELLMVAGVLVVAGVAVTMVGGAAPSLQQGDAADIALPVSVGDTVPERSIAVLPLDNHSPAPEDAYFAAAMTEQITSALSDVPSLQVSARNSAAQFRESGMSLGEFARGELGVAHALEGSVQLQDDRALITVQLIDTATEDHVWTETYRVELIDVLDVQVDVAREVADRLAATFSREDRERILAGATDDPVAQELYLRASSNAELESAEERAERYVLLRRAVKQDPSFSLAWEALGVTHFFEAVTSGDSRWRDSIRAAYGRAIDAADHPSLGMRFEATRALLLGEDRGAAVSLLTEAARTFPNDDRLLMSLATGYWYTGDLASSIQWTRRAIELDPLNAAQYVRLAQLYTILGLDDAALDGLRRSIEIAPGSIAPWNELVDFHLLNEDLELAAAAVDTLYARGDEDAPLADALVLVGAGDLDAAYRILADLPESDLSRNTWALPMIAYTALAHGDSAYALRLIERTREQLGELPADPIVTGRLLENAAVTGDVEASVQALERYIASGGRRARAIRASPTFSKVRSDPEFQALLEELEDIVARQRRQVRRDLAEEGGT